MSRSWNTDIRGLHMAYNNNRSRSVKDTDGKEDKRLPRRDQRSGNVSDREAAIKTKYYGSNKRERIVSKDGKLEVVAA